MSNVNPYAPPQAVVADVHVSGGEVQPVRRWSGKGRIGRLRYLAHITGAYLLMILFVFVASFALGFIGAGAAATAVGGLGFIVYLVFLLLKTIQRSHDMNWSGWTAILALIPLVGLVWIFNPGTEGDNRYGAPPPPNTLGVKILGLGLPVGIFVIGILAAIALPAYQDYVKRAKAAQVR